MKTAVSIALNGFLYFCSHALTSVDTWTNGFDSCGWCSFLCYLMWVAFFILWICNYQYVWVTSDLKNELLLHLLIRVSKAPYFSVYQKINLKCGSMFIQENWIIGGQMNVEIDGLWRWYFWYEIKSLTVLLFILKSIQVVWLELFSFQ